MYINVNVHVVSNPYSTSLRKLSKRSLTKYSVLHTVTINLFPPSPLSHLQLSKSSQISSRCCVYIRIYVCMCMFVCMYMYIYVCVCVYAYVHVCVCKWVCISKKTGYTILELMESYISLYIRSIMISRSTSFFHSLLPKE